jgi:hypothetical protein
MARYRLGQAHHPRAEARRARTTKGWAHLTPRKPADRAKLFMRCGPDAFLMPNRANPGHSKFPIMPKTGPCRIDCRGLRSAKARARQYEHYSVANKADAIARRYSCSWEV